MLNLLYYELKLYFWFDVYKEIPKLVLFGVVLVRKLNSKEFD